MARKAVSRFRPCLRAVARMLVRMAEASAPQSERNPPMTLRWMTDGRRSRSELLSTSSLATMAPQAEAVAVDVPVGVAVSVFVTVGVEVGVPVLVGVAEGVPVR